MLLLPRQGDGMALGDTFFFRMADGTVKQLNPFTGAEVWTVPGRMLRIDDQLPRDGKTADRTQPEKLCHYCEANWAMTPPEKSRLVRSENGWTTYHHVPLSGLHTTQAEFRRIPKLFETVSFDYWAKNYGCKLSGRAQAWKNEYIAEPGAKEQLEALLRTKLQLSGRNQDEITALLSKRVLTAADPFFGGCHELVIPRRHLQPDAVHPTQIEHSGSMTPDQHFQYFRLTIEALREIHRENRYVRYVAIFQNYLASAGASCDHLHKQLVGLDEWGAHLEKEVEQLRRDPNIYNHFAANQAIYHNLQVASNDHALVIVEFGHRWPTLCVYSKSRVGRPEEHSTEELRQVSDLVHACHAVATPRLGSTEEWFYSPRDLTLWAPWRILIKWRITIHTGFEGGTRIYLNPVDPWELRDMAITRLLRLRSEGKVEKMCIGEECSAEPNPLQYIRNY